MMQWTGKLEALHHGCTMQLAGEMEVLDYETVQLTGKMAVPDIAQMLPRPGAFEVPI